MARRKGTWTQRWKDFKEADDENKTLFMKQ